MIVTSDVAELFHLGKETGAPVAVVKNKQRFEWPSMMYFDNTQCQKLTSTYINDESTTPQDFSWASEVGELPTEWNFCVGYDEPQIEDDRVITPKLIHYTMGVPHFPETRHLPFAQEWWDRYTHMTSNCSWLELMGNSVHAKPIFNEIQDRMDHYANR